MTRNLKNLDVHVPQNKKNCSSIFIKLLNVELSEFSEIVCSIIFLERFCFRILWALIQPRRTTNFFLLSFIKSLLALFQRMDDDEHLRFRMNISIGMKKFCTDRFHTYQLVSQFIFKR